MRNKFTPSILALFLFTFILSSCSSFAPATNSYANRITYSQRQPSPLFQLLLPYCRQLHPSLHLNAQNIHWTQPLTMTRTPSQWMRPFSIPTIQGNQLNTLVIASRAQSCGRAVSLSPAFPLTAPRQRPTPSMVKDWILPYPLFFKPEAGDDHQYSIFTFTSFCRSRKTQVFHVRAFMVIPNDN